MRIVGVEDDVVVAREGHHRGERHLVAAASDEHVPPEVLRRSQLQVGMLRVAGELPVLLHALQEIGHPAGVGLDVDGDETREVLEHAVPDEARHRRHRLEGMSEDVPRRVRVHALAVGRQMRRAGIVDADRTTEALDLRPQREVVAVVQVPAGDRVRPHVEADRAQVGRPARLGDGALHVLQRQHRGPAQPTGCGGRILRAPVVVGQAAGGEQRGVLELAPEELAADGRVEDLDVDALAVHVGEPARRTEAGLARCLEALEAAHQRGDELRRVEGILAFRRQRFPLDQVRAASGLEPRRAIAEFRRNVAFPDVGRLHLMGVGVDDPAAVAHGTPPLRSSIVQPRRRTPGCSPARPDRA